MGILDKIVEWIAEQVMNLLDMISTSVLGALGCNMDSFLRYFPAAETMYSVFVALAIGLILLNWVWNVFKNFGLVAGLEAEDPIRLSIRSVLFIFLAFFSGDIVNIALDIGGTPYNWILTSELPPLSFADFNSVIVAILGVVANGSVALIALVLLLILAWNVNGTVYRGSTIIVSAEVTGDRNTDFTPSNPLSVTMSAVMNEEEEFDSQAKSVICPKSETNLVWFIVEIPETG